MMNVPDAGAGARVLAAPGDGVVRGGRITHGAMRGARTRECPGPAPCYTRGSSIRRYG